MASCKIRNLQKLVTQHYVACINIYKVSLQINIRLLISHSPVSNNNKKKSFYKIPTLWKNEYQIFFVKNYKLHLTQTTLMIIVMLTFVLYRWPSWISYPHQEYILCKGPFKDPSCTNIFCAYSFCSFKEKLFIHFPIQC
jgi:hypothetical protein